jgi:hypothetical protein
MILFRLPHAPVPSRPDYSRSLEYDDFRSMKKPPKPMDPHKVEHWDMSFWVSKHLVSTKTDFCFCVELSFARYAT